MSPNTDLLELTEFVKAVRERKDREASTRKAIALARKKAAMREQFRPVAPHPAKPVKLRF